MRGRTENHSSISSCQSHGRIGGGGVTRNWIQGLALIRRPLCHWAICLAYGGFFKALTMSPPIPLLPWTHAQFESTRTMKKGRRKGPKLASKNLSAPMQKPSQKNEPRNLASVLNMPQPNGAVTTSFVPFTIYSSIKGRSRAKWYISPEMPSAPGLAEL